MVAGLDKLAIGIHIDARLTDERRDIESHQGRDVTRNKLMVDKLREK